ncbi:hypothetical protein YC2023_052778 [Brassica napus]
MTLCSLMTRKRFRLEIRKALLSFPNDTHYFFFIVLDIIATTLPLCSLCSISSIMKGMCHKKKLSPLATCMQNLQQGKMAINLQITAQWLRAGAKLDFFLTGCKIIYKKRLIDSSIIFHFTVLTKFVEITAVTAPRPTGIYMYLKRIGIITRFNISHSRISQK